VRGEFSRRHEKKHGGRVAIAGNASVVRGMQRFGTTLARHRMLIEGSSLTSARSRTNFRLLGKGKAMKKIHGFVWGLTAFLTMLWAGHVGVMGADQQGEATTREQPAATGALETERETPAVSQAGDEGIDDYSIAAWLISEATQQASIVEWAEQRAHSDQVRNFAGETANDYRGFVAHLHKEAVLARGRVQPDFGPVLQQLAQHLERHAASPRGRIVLGFRGESDVEQTPERRQQRQELREQVRDARRDAAQARRDDDAEESPTEEREELRDARYELREQRREAAREIVREALPVIRQNLPWILDSVGQAIEDANAEARDQRWIRLKEQLTQREKDAVTAELEKKEGAAFDQAFLQYQIGAHTRMKDTLEVFRQHASAEFHGTLENGLKIANERLEQARQLLTQVGSGDAGDGGSDG
jgi:hypothetical protein